MQKNQIQKFTESGVLLALATVLSFIPLFNLPQGGTVTVCSLMPLAILAYRYGFKWGILCSFLYSLIQLVIGIKNISYCKTWVAVVVVILFDYLIPYTVFGITGIFKNKIKNQNLSISFGMIFCALIRFLCHVFSGYTVWGEWAEGEWLEALCRILNVSSPKLTVLIYSVAYNSYVLVDIAVSVVAVCALGLIINYREQGFVRVKRK